MEHHGLMPRSAQVAHCTRQALHLRLDGAVAPERVDLDAHVKHRKELAGKVVVSLVSANSTGASAAVSDVHGVDHASAPAFVLCSVGHRGEPARQTCDLPPNLYRGASQRRCRRVRLRHGKWVSLSATGAIGQRSARPVELAGKLGCCAMANGRRCGRD